MGAQLTCGQFELGAYGVLADPDGEGVAPCHGGAVTDYEGPWCTLTHQGNGCVSRERLLVPVGATVLHICTHMHTGWALMCVRVSVCACAHLVVIQCCHWTGHLTSGCEGVLTNADSRCASSSAPPPEERREGVLACLRGKE